MEILSAGYQRSASPLAFGRHLTHHGVTLAIDVRRRPTSQRPGYDAAGLSDAIEYAGIAYRSVPRLGNLDVLNDLWRDDPPAARAALAEHLTRTEAPLLARLGAILDDDAVCLVCVCPDADHCHRRVILDLLADAHPGLRHRDISPA